MESFIVPGAFPLDIADRISSFSFAGSFGSVSI
jgi:hypothetical protein